MLACRSLTVSIGDRALVRHLDLTLRAGDLVCVLGPNGVGKTRTLQVLAGLYSPSAGTVHLDGEDIAHLPRRTVARKLGLLLQDDTDPYPCTVFQAAMLGRHPHVHPLSGPSAADQGYAEAALTDLGLGHLRNRSVASLSGGERRRLGLARLLVQDPAVMLLDEPTNHLDPAQQVRVLRLLHRLAAGGRAIAITVHDAALAARVGGTALLMFTDGTWLMGPAERLVTAHHLERLFGTCYEVWRRQSHELPLPAVSDQPSP